MNPPFGTPEIGWNWMADTGGALGGASPGPGPSSTQSGEPKPGGDGVDTSQPGQEGAGKELEGSGRPEGSEPAPSQAEGPGQEPRKEPGPESEPAKPPTSDWRDKRIATLTRRLKEVQERSQAQGQPPNQDQGLPPGTTQADIDRIAEQRARELALVHDFNRRCDEVATSGRSSFGEAVFNERVANLQKLVDGADPSSVQAYNSFLAAAIDTGEAPKLLHELGSDLDEAQRIMSLPATRMAVELTKRAMRPEPQVSGTPRPIQTVGGRGVSHEAISPDDADRADHLGTAEWMRRREAQIAERQRARR